MGPPGAMASPDAAADRSPFHSAECAPLLMGADRPAADPEDDAGGGIVVLESLQELERAQLEAQEERQKRTDETEMARFWGMEQTPALINEPLTI